MWGLSVVRAVRSLADSTLLSYHKTTPKPWGPTDRIGPARPPTHDARSVGAVKAYPSSVSVTVVRAVRSLADSTLLSYKFWFSPRLHAPDATWRGAEPQGETNGRESNYKFALLI